MELVTLSAGAGRVLARDLPTARPVPAPLLRAGVVLHERCLGHLAAAGVVRVWVQDDRPEPVELLPAATREALVVRLHGLLPALAGGEPLGTPELQELDALADVVVRTSAPVDARPVLADPAPADAHDVRHAVGAAALGVLLARRLGATGVDVLRLAVALLVCDLVPPLSETGHHATAAARALRDGHLAAARIALEHHERADGLGVPHGRPAEAQHPLSAVAAAAAAVDGWVRRAPASEPAPVVAALAAVSAEGALPPAVLGALAAVLPVEHPVPA